MRIAVFGGTGFVGSYLVDALVAAGMAPVLLVRPGSESKVQHRSECSIVAGHVGDIGSVTSVLSQADAVIYNIGILRESTARGITFEELHFKAVRRVVDAAVHVGVERMLLMSANGVRADGTAYQRSKYDAEQYLRGSELAWTILRPSVIFGDPRGRMEFATQLYRDIIESPLPAPLFYPGLLPAAPGQFQLSPVHVEDVAQAFVAALQSPASVGRVLHLGGPDALTWREILETLAAVAGRHKAMLPVPAFGVTTAAAMFERFEAFPITRDQIRMLLEGNVCDSRELAALGIDPRPFDRAHLGYLAHGDGAGNGWHQDAA